HRQPTVHAEVILYEERFVVPATVEIGRHVHRGARDLSQQKARKPESYLAPKRSTGETGLSWREVIGEIRAIAVARHPWELDLAAEFHDVTALHPRHAVVELVVVCDVIVAEPVADIGFADAVDGAAKVDLWKAAVRAGNVQPELSGPVAVAGSRKARVAKAAERCRGVVDEAR